MWSERSTVWTWPVMFETFSKHQGYWVVKKCKSKPKTKEGSGFGNFWDSIRVSILVSGPISWKWNKNWNKFELWLDNFIPFFIPHGRRSKMKKNKQIYWICLFFCTYINVWGKMENVWITYHFFNEITSRPSKHWTNATWREDVDGKTGLLTDLLEGKQGWKCPVALLATCCGSKSLKVILIDSDFRAYPVLNPLSHCNLLQISKRRLSRTLSSAEFGSFGILRSPVESATSITSQTPSHVFKSGLGSISASK